ncbi:MAG TPA: Ni/Fe hydrogenase subunit alpha, partial [Methanomicrobiales archaeon]|nr:Ni/Fe hydrogenase subunit alpha [Methanomicrobiales archaeon]
MKRLSISPVTRIEGHAQVSIDLDDKGEVAGAHFNVVELRGFEKFLVGAAVEEAPRITPRICGICPAAHHLASAKAVDQIFGAEVPVTGRKLRELLMHGQYIHSHALHFFMLAAPDFLIGHDAPPQERNVLGLAKKAPDIAKKAIEVRKLGQRITESVGGKPIHPSNAVPGGMSKALSEADRTNLLSMAERGLSIAQEGWETARGIMNSADRTFGSVETAFMGMTNNNLYSPYEGRVQMVGADKSPIGSFTGSEYLQYIEEYSLPSTYLKFCKLKSGGQHYRVGPLARLNICEGMGTPRADAALKEYRSAFGPFVQSPLAYNIARYIEFLSSCERAVALLQDASISGSDVRMPVSDVKKRRGVGIV